jgi:aspartokinase-like uncharacterized kinase
MSGRRLPRVVVKVGGSLFTDTDWFDLLLQWLHRQTAATGIVVLGGGEAVDAVQAEQSTIGTSDSEAHWRCIRVMGDHARSLAEKMPAWRLISDPREMNDYPDFKGFILEADAFMEAVDAALGPRALPESWDVSSDSIAARAAELFEADELVLLKSTLPRDVHALGDYVDPYFAEASRNLPSIRFVNLRDPAFPQLRLR